LAPVFDNYKIGTTVWSPLAAGILTGKYCTGKTEGERMGKLNDTVQDMLHFNELFGDENIEKTRKMFKDLEEIGKSIGATLP